MRLDAFLFVNALASSRSRAKNYIISGRCLVDGKVVLKPSFDVDENALVELLSSEESEFVGRGGLKLEAALNHFEIDVADKICADIGASTGGFTDCLLSRGAKKVYAIDAGSGQLDKKLLSDSRVVSLENTNARYISKETLNSDIIDIVVMDVSFISQKLIYPAIKEIASDCAYIITLIKPQFEAGKQHLNKNGIVKDEKIHLKVIREIKSEAEIYGFETLGVIDSPIMGGSGNKEFLICFKNGEKE